MNITATVEHDTIKLPEGVHLPDGTRVKIEPVEKQMPSLLERMSPFVGMVKDAPSDLAENHDHYLYGAPKKRP